MGVLAEVPVPTDFGLGYEDLTLTTPDGVTLRSYLMRQQKHLKHYQAGEVEASESQTDEEVSHATTVPHSQLLSGSIT